MGESLSKNIKCDTQDRKTSYEILLLFLGVGDMGWFLSRHAVIWEKNEERHGWLPGKFRDWEVSPQWGV